METEKVCVNLPPVELGKIDALVAQGVYTSRTDVIRAGIRRVLDDEATIVDQGVRRLLEEHAARPDGIISAGSGVGLFRVTRENLEQARRQRQRVRVAVIGMVVIDEDVSVELADETIDQIRILGALRGPNPVLDRLTPRIRRGFGPWG
jgi:Arc/MetJ-type ribon-helix-helix transcriptional regulator